MPRVARRLRPALMVLLLAGLAGCDSGGLTGEESGYLHDAADVRVYELAPAGGETIGIYTYDRSVAATDRQRAVVRKLLDNNLLAELDPSDPAAATFEADYAVSADDGLVVGIDADAGLAEVSFTDGRSRLVRTGGDLETPLREILRPGG